MQTEYRIKEEEELAVIAEDVLAELKKRQDDSGAVILALHGDLGSGKTTFMQILAKELGITDTITSPTFVVMKKYSIESGPFSELVHIDAYRIEDIDEMRPLKFDDELTEKGSIIGIEWAEKIADLLPPHTLHLTFTIEGDERIITTHA